MLRAFVVMEQHRSRLLNKVSTSLMRGVRTWWIACYIIM
jgi:hypothetical protein